MTGDLVAILRGVRPDEVVQIAEAIVAAGISTIEVPLNSPEPLESIRLLADRFADRAIVGAGTVLTADDVRACQQAGAQIIVSPNCDPEVIAESVGRGMASYPGVATVSEAFTAIRAGAENLKMFPASALGVTSLKAWREVLPKDVALLPVGGVDADNLGEWARAGASGAGFGSSLYKAGRSADEVAERAAALVAAWASAS